MMIIDKLINVNSKFIHQGDRPILVEGIKVCLNLSRMIGDE